MSVTVQEIIQTVTVNDGVTTQTVNVIEEVVGIVTVGTQGPPGAGANSWSSGTPVESPNGVRTVFTTPTSYITGGLLVFLNGLWETYITQTSSNTFTFSSAPVTGDAISIFYRTT